MYYYPATFVPHPLHPERYDVTFVDLPGCVSSGDTLVDALRMAQEALTLHLGTMLEDGDPIPTPSSLEAARQADEAEALAENDPLPQESIWQYVLADPSPRKAKAEPPVRLSISLKPSVIEKIDAIAEDMGLTRSGVINVATRDYINRMQG
ncbi:MAG: type II toxin-antitoxin system HicB family antitoxin [Desulfovibrio sp.]|jgi:predicted RNase H-like HicB family nuclease|nr:type II toxin-antitoxin system HicB family antitoxin [Desulfovibrio sp.]